MEANKNIQCEMGNGFSHRGDIRAIDEMPFCSEVIKTLKGDNAF